MSIFKEAKASYQDKKAQVKSERSLNRAQTFDQTRSVHRHYDDFDYDQPRRRSHDDHSEITSPRSRNSKSVYSRRSSRDHPGAKNRPPPLTESNLQTLSEVSSTSPSKAPYPNTYRSPYAETLPRDMLPSRTELARTEMRSVVAPSTRRRRSSSSELGQLPRPREGKEIDMDLAYGNVPPDLESRVDLDPAYQEESKRRRAQNLVQRVESLLDEAHCVRHSATAIMAHLQQNPDAAAAVALTLAELSSAITKLSPAFIGLLKGGSPAVFALLASPQFLIGTGIAVGVTIVMFGGWKIVKKVKEARAAAAAREAMAFDGVPMDRPAPLRTQSDLGGALGGVDEALVLEEMSTIETWRRGIMPLGVGEEAADMELITPEAERAHREDHRRGRSEADVASRKSARTYKTTSKSHKSHRSSTRDRRDVPDRKSSKNAATSVANSNHHHHGRGSSSSSKKKKKTPEKVEVKAIEDGSTAGRANDDMDLVMRPKTVRQGSSMIKALFKNKREKEKERDREKEREAEMAFAERS